jgi:hypothetical protein
MYNAMQARGFAAEAPVYSGGHLQNSQNFSFGWSLFILLIECSDELIKLFPFRIKILYCF